MTFQFGRCSSSSALESLEAAIAYAKKLDCGTNVYYTEDPFPHGHWHVIQSDFAHYDQHPKFELRAKIRWYPTVELIKEQHG